MSKRLFDDAIGEVPPSTVDVDAAIARGRRADRLRRVASPVLATVAAVAVLLGGVAVALLSDNDPGGSAPAAPPSRTTTPSPAPTTSESPCADTIPTAPPQPERPAVTESRLTTVLTEVVSSKLPEGATLERNPIAKGPGGKPVGPLQFKHFYSKPKAFDGGCQGGEDFYDGMASVKWSGGTGSLLIHLGREGGWNGSADGMGCDPPGVAVDETSCRMEERPNGDLVKITSLGTGAAMKGSRTNRLDVVRADQTSVVIESANMATSGKYPGPPTASSIPLSHEQLMEIALDPRVTLYPR